MTNFAEIFKTDRDSLNNKYLSEKPDPADSCSIPAMRCVHQSDNIPPLTFDLFVL